MKRLAILSAAAFFALAPAAVARNVHAPAGKRVHAPARGATLGARSPRRGAASGLMPGDGNPAHANGGNGPGGRY